MQVSTQTESIVYFQKVSGGYYVTLNSSAYFTAGLLVLSPVVTQT